MLIHIDVFVAVQRMEGRMEDSATEFHAQPFRSVHRLFGVCNVLIFACIFSTCKYKWIHVYIYIYIYVYIHVYIYTRTQARAKARAFVLALTQRKRKGSGLSVANFGY